VNQLEISPEGRRLLSYENEKNSLASLKILLTHTLEVLGMWKVLCDHEIHIILQVNIYF
jgi:nuclear pore complex protein Nup155